MNKHETTEKRVRSAQEIDFREIKELTKRAEEGDEVAKQEVSIVAHEIEKSGLVELLTDNLLTDERRKDLSDFSRAIIKNYIEVFNRIHETDFDSLDQIEDYLKKKELSPEVDFEEIVETTVIRPKDFVHTLGRLTDKVFSNELTVQKGQKKKRGVYLDKKKTISIFATVNYDKVIEDLGANAKVPELTEDDRQVLDGIITNLVAGNNIMTYDMIYRGFSGKIDNGDIYIPDEIYSMIDTALDHFRGILRIDNQPEVEIKGNTVDRIIFDEPILHFSRLQRATINGKNIDGEKIGLIVVYDFPSIYKLAQANGNEIDTRDIKLLDVPKINNTPENLKLKRYLYNRVIAMRNNYERKVLQSHKQMTLSRKILFSSVFEYIGAEVDKSNAGRKKKEKVVKKIESILNYWKDFGLIAGYTKTKKNGSNEVDGIEINFVKKLEENT